MEYSIFYTLTNLSFQATPIFKPIPGDFIFFYTLLLLLCLIHLMADYDNEVAGSIPVISTIANVD